MTGIVLAALVGWLAADVEAKPAAARLSAAEPTVVATPTATAKPTTVAKPAVGAPLAADVTSELGLPAPAERPAWVDEPSGMREGGVYLMHVYAGPAFTRTECEAKLTAEIESRLREYVAEVMPHDAPAAVTFDMARLQLQIVKRTWEERVRTKDFDVVYLHAEVGINDKLRREWQTQGIDALRSRRSRAVMIGYAAALAAVAAVFAFLKWSGRRTHARAALLPGAAVVAIIALGTILMKFLIGVG